MIRQAENKDISRIAEILIFTKRMTYRPIFRDDMVSFGEMQVLPLAEEYKDHPERLAHMWVYEEGFVKGLITLRTVDPQKGVKELHIQELYVDVFSITKGLEESCLRLPRRWQGSREWMGLFFGYWRKMNAPVYSIEGTALSFVRKESWRKGHRNI